MYELGITAGSGGIVLLLLGTIAQGFKKGESFAAHPLRLAAVVAPFMVLAAEPWMGKSQAAFLIRIIGAGMFGFVAASVIVAIRDKHKEEDPWTTLDVILTGVFLALSGLGACWLLTRALH